MARQRPGGAFPSTAHMSPSFTDFFSSTKQISASPCGKASPQNFPQIHLLLRQSSSSSFGASPGCIDHPHPLMMEPVLLMQVILHQFVPLFTRFYTPQLVQDFSHQQYVCQRFPMCLWCCFLGRRGPSENSTPSEQPKYFSTSFLRKGCPY